MNKKNLFFIGLLATACVTASALYAGEDLDLIKPATPDGLVKIDAARGDVTIIGWDKAEISVEGELDDLAKELVFNVDGNRTLIKVEMPRRNISWGDGSDLDIHVPKNSRVDFVGVSTDVVAKAIAGGIRINSVSGDIKAKDLEGHLMLTSVSGDLVIERSAGKLRSSSVSGDVDVLSHTGQADVETVSGNVEIQILENEKLRVKSISGEIDIMSDLLQGASVDIQSVSGEIELELKGDVSAEFDLDGGLSGSIDNDLTDHKVSKTRGGHETLKMTLGDGAGQVLIKTLSADIKIE